MSIAKWQACPVCNGDGIVEGREYDQIIGIQCTACNSEHLIHLETGLPPSRHRALWFGSGVEFTEQGPRVWTGTGQSVSGTTCGERHDVTIENPNIPHTLTGRGVNHKLEWVNEGLAGMENPPPSPPIKGKSRSHVL